MKDFLSVGMEKISLKNDIGIEFNFYGRLFSECSYFDEDSEAITRQRLYVTEQGDQIYSIIRVCGANKVHKIYELKVVGEDCIINNGQYEMIISIEILLSSVRALCGFNSENSAALIASLEETLKAANI